MSSSLVLPAGAGGAPASRDAWFRTSGVRHRATRTSEANTGGVNTGEANTGEASTGSKVGLTLGRCVLIALALEAAVLAASAAFVLSAPAAPRPVETPVDIVIEETKVIEPVPEPPKPEPKMESQPKPVAPRVVKAEAPAIPVSAPVPPQPEMPPAPAAPLVSQVAEAPPPSPPPPPAPAVNAAAAREAEFAAKVKAAIQAAVLYPAAARSMGASGRARIEFHLRNRATSQLRVLQSSGTGMLDRAALDAVSRAQYPAAPDTLKDKDQHYQVYVLFDLNTTR